MISFVKPDPTVITRVERLSILIRDIRVTLLQLRKTMLLIRGLRLAVPSFGDLKTVESELMRRHEEVQNACRLLLEPLFEGIDFGHKRVNHWCLSMDDIKCGLCKLEEIVQYNGDGKPIKFGRKFIILLDDYDDLTLGKFYKGELIPLEKAIHFIDNIPERKSKLKGLYDAVISSIEMASRYRATKHIE